MTAPQHTTQPKADKKDSESSIGTMQRCWFVTLGLLGGLGFVASHVSFARAESVEIADAQLQPIPEAFVDSSTDFSTDSSATAEAFFTTAAPAYVPSAAAVPVAAPVVTAAPTLAVEAASVAATPAPSIRPAPSIQIDVQPAHKVSPTATPAVTAVASPTFASVKKPVATKATRRSPLAGLVEAGALAGPLSAYVAMNAPTAATDDTALDGDSAAIPDIYPEDSAAPPPIVDIAPDTAPAAPVQPTELVPAALPEGTNLPEEYNSVFVDPTDYSVGATQSPDVVVSEQSTGCEFTVGSGRAVPNGACGSVPASVATPGGYAQAPVNAPVNAPSYSTQSPVASSARAVNVGPVSFSASGIRFNSSTTAAGREYLNRSVRPLVNLQAAQQFIFPLAIPSPITSLFGFRIHPISGDRRFHAGTDIGAAQGTPVLAAQAGTVVSADYAGGYGLMVVLDHKVEGTELQSRYAHLSDILVEPGKSVKKGDVIGLVGSTGNSTGPHLHFEMAQNTADGWVLVNPDGLLQDSLVKLVKALNSPMQAMNFNLSDLNLNLSVKAPTNGASSSVTLPSLPGQNGVPFRPAQPNAS